MNKKQANILDWPKSSLEPAIFNEDNTLKPEVKEFILGFIHSFAKANNFKDTFSWVTQVKFVGSLTTNMWNSNSDMDIHIEVDLPKFVEIEHPEMTEKEASDYLDEIRKQVDQVKAKVPQTQHPTEIYFETEFTTRASQAFSGTYSVLEDKWLTPPHIVEKDFDIATLHPDLLNLAKETASELDAAFGAIKCEVQDIKELGETISEWPPEQRDLFEKKLQKKLDDLTQEIQELVIIREDVAEKRKHYEAISEQEVRFKYLQKYFYMHVLTDLKTLLKQSPDLTIKDIPVVENIMHQANLNKFSNINTSYWVSPQGEEYPLDEETHMSWVELHESRLMDKGMHISDNVEDEMKSLFQLGWTRIIQEDLDSEYQFAIHVGNLDNIPSSADSFIANHFDPNRMIIVDDEQYRSVAVSDPFPSLQKAVDRASQQERMQQANLNKKAGFGEIQYWLDPMGKEYNVQDDSDNHTDWLIEHLNLFKNQYGLDKNFTIETDDDINKIYNWTAKNGWVRVGDTNEFDSAFSVVVQDMRHIPDFVNDFIAKHYESGVIEVEDGKNMVKISDPFPSIQKVVNKALSNPMKSANLKLAYQDDENRILVDMDDTICHEESDGQCGEPMEGVREALNKLQEMGYEIVIFSARADNEHGEDEIRNYLESHNIPYDSIFQGEKPIARFQIDDRAIHFDNWNSVLKQIEKSDKTASLDIEAADAYYHGGSGSSIRQMAKDGYVMAPLETGNKYQSPLAGRAYLTKDLGYALIYAVGGDMVGYQGDPSNYLDGPEGGVVLVAPNEETLIPDEDWLGEKLVSGYQGEDNSIYKKLQYQQALTPVFNNLQRYHPKSSRLYDMSYQSMLGKMAIRILIKYDPEYLKELAKESHTLSHEGNLKVLKAWVFDKARDNPKLKPDGSNFFEIAQEIPVNTGNLVYASLDKEAYWGAGYWIAPDGKIFTVREAGGNGTHHTWVGRHKKLLREQYGINPSDMEELISEGWVRIGDFGGETGVYLIELPSVRNIPSSVDDAIAQFFKQGQMLYVNDSSGNYLEISDPFPTLQQAVNKELQRIKTHASQDLPIIDPATLNRKEPYALFIGTQRYSEDVAMDLFDVFGEHPMITKSNVVPTVTLDTLIKENIPVIGKEPRAADKQPIQDLSRVVKTAKLGSEYDFSSTHFLLPKEIAEKIIRWAVETIPEEEIVHDSKDPGTKGIQLESHITLKYGLLTDDFEKVKKALEGEKAPHIKFGKTSFFEPEGKDYDVVIIPVDSEDLQKLNGKLCSQVEHEDLQFKEYHPHVTVAYVQRGKGKEFDGKDIITGEELELSELTFSPKNGEKRILELKGTTKESSFMPSNTDLAPSDDWAGTVGYPTNESMDAPQNKSDEETWYSPENDRPRTKNFWEKVLGLFMKKPLSKKEPVKDIVPVKEARVEKQAGQIIRLENASNEEFRVFKDPSPEQAVNLLNTSHNKELRYILDDSGLYIWDAYYADHPETAWDLGLGYDINRIGYIDNERKALQWTGGLIEEKPVLAKKDNSIQKKATLDRMWIDPSGQVYYLEGDIHASWIVPNLEMLERDYGFKIPKRVWNQRANYYKLIEEQGDEDNLEIPDVWGIQEEMFKKGWVRIGDAAGTEGVGVELLNLRMIPVFLDNILAKFLDDGEKVIVEDKSKNHVTVTYPFKSLQQAVNKALSSPAKIASRTVKFWIDPNGKEYPLPQSLHHGDWIKQNTDLLLKYGIDFNKSRDLWQDMLKQGWTRVLTYPSGSMGIEIEDRFNIPSYLDDFIAKYYTLGQKIEIGDEEGSHLLSITDPFPTLQDAITKKDRYAFASKKTAKQWVTPKEPVNQPGMSWSWADEIYNYVDENWQDLLLGWLELDPNNYVKPVVLIEKIYEDEGGVSAWVHIEFVNTAGNTDAFMKLVISANIQGEVNIEPEGKEYFEHLTDWETEVLDYGKSDELEKSSSYGPTNYQGPSVADHGYQNSAWDDMNVTLSDEEDDKFLDQNGDGGYPNRWMGRHRGPYYTNEGKVVKMLEETSALETLPEQQPITENTNAGTAVQMDDGSIYFSDESNLVHVKLIKQLGLPPEHIVSGGYIKDGIYHDAGPRSDTMRYVEMAMAQQRVDKKMKERQAFGKKEIIASSIEEVAGVKVYVNPTWKQAVSLLSNAQYVELRGIIDPTTGDLFIWDSDRLTHENVIRVLGIDIDPYAEDEQADYLSVMGDAGGLDYMFMKQQEVKNKLSKRPKKQAAISGRVINTILELIEQNGGATFNVANNKNLVGTDAYAVAIYPDREQIVPEVDFDIVEGYIIQNEDLLSNPNNSFGAWISGGKTYLDIVATIPNKEQAMELGRKHNQLAIFDLKNLIEIPLQRTAKLAGVYTDKDQQAIYDKQFSDRWRDSSDPIDGGFEYYDYSQLNGNDYPSAKDLDKERGLLDQIEKPIDRNNPVGLGEYAITYYDAFPSEGDNAGM